MWKCFAICVALSLWNTAHSFDEVIHIGAIFEEGYEYLQWAFNLSIDRVNSDPALLPKFKLRALTAVIPQDDAYSAMMTVCDWINKGVAAIFGPQSLRSTATVQTIAESAGIPFIPGRWEYRSYSSGTTVYLYPHADTKGYALKSFIVDRAWKRMAIIHSDPTALIRLNPILLDDPDKISISFVEYKKTDIEISQVNDLSEYKKLFKDMKAKNHKNFVIDCPAEHVIDILNQAEEMSMLSLYNNFLFTSLDVHTVDLSKFQSYNCNITTFRVINFDSEEYHRISKSLENDIAYVGIKDQVRPYLNKTQFAVMYDAVLHFAHSLRNIGLRFHLKVKPIACFSENSWEQGKMIVDEMKKGNTEGLTGNITIDEVGFRTDFQLMESRLTSTETKLEGLWDKSGFTSLRNFTEESKEAAGILSHLKLRVCSIANPPYLIKVEDPEDKSGKPKFKGHSIDLMEELAIRANLTFEFSLVKDDQYGKKNKDGEWNGMIGELIRNEADLIVADFTITTQRQEAVDFAHPYMDLGISILYSKPEEKEENLFSFMSPFSAGVWLYMATATLGVTLILYVMGRFTPYEWLNPHPCDVEPEELENQFTLAETAWVVVGCLLQQGGDIEPKATSTRMASGYWWFFTLIMVSSYTANLAAFLTAGRMEATIRSAEDLVGQQKVQYGCVEGGSTQGFFKNSEASLYSRMWSAMEGAEPSVFMKNNEAGINRVLKGNYAFFMESTTIEYQVSSNCKLAKVGGQLDSKRYGIALPKGSITRETLSYHLLKMQETGINNVLKERWWKSQGSCPSDEESSDTLGLENLGGVFLILLIGLPVACIAVVWEFSWSLRKIPKNKREPLCKELCKEIKATVTGKNTTKQVPDEEEDEEKIISKGSSSSTSSSSTRSSPSGSISQNASKSTSKVSKKS